MCLCTVLYRLLSINDPGRLRTASIEPPIQERLAQVIRCVVWDFVLGTTPIRQTPPVSDGRGAVAGPRIR